MKLVTFTSVDHPVPVPGVLSGQDEVVAIPGYKTLLECIEDGPKGFDAAASALSRGPMIKLAAAKLLAPIPRPPRIFGIGLNYAKHAAESNAEVQKVPTVFMKLTSAVVGPGDPIVLPKASDKPDYEAELGVVIGKAGYQIPASEAMDYVLGYTIVNDVSARDFQRATTQWTLGKSFPGFAPMGPSITTKDEVADPHALEIQLTIDGEVMQYGNTSDLIFKIPAIIEYISSATRLEAGDVISTGTPEGVGMGRTPPRWLKSGEEVVITIAGLGELRNPTEAE